MQQISFDKFKNWAIKRFGEDEVKAKGGDEIRLNSIFIEDTKYKLYISVSGGKKKRKYGVYHCFKTDQKGSLIKFIQTVDKCSKKQAFITLFGNVSTIRDKVEDVEEFLNKIEKQNKIEIPKKIIVELPESSQVISTLSANDKFRKSAETYLKSRKLPIDDFLICKKGKYYNRIIIPYYDQDGDIVYFNGRAIPELQPDGSYADKYTKYKFPKEEELGVGKGDVLYFAGDFRNWPKEGDEVYVCEGEFNAKALALCGLPAFACGGKSMTEKQAAMLCKYKIVLCLDNDKAGKDASEKMEMFVSPIRQIQSKDAIQIVKPSDFCKDWNNMTISYNFDVVYNYIMLNKRPLDNEIPYGAII